MKISLVIASSLLLQVQARRSFQDWNGGSTLDATVGLNGDIQQQQQQYQKPPQYQQPIVKKGRMMKRSGKYGDIYNGDLPELAEKYGIGDKTAPEKGGGVASAQYHMKIPQRGSTGADIANMASIEELTEASTMYGEKQDLLNFALPNAKFLLQELDNYMTTSGAAAAGCSLQHEHCVYWASVGYCTHEEHSSFMTQSCAPVCESCQTGHQPQQQQRQMTESSPALAALNTVDELADATLPYGTRQDLRNFSPDQAKPYVASMERYFTQVVMVDPQLTGVTCTNQHEHCVYWASVGECQNTPDYMLTTCGPACASCHALLGGGNYQQQQAQHHDAANGYQQRCAFDPNAPTVWVPGTLNAMFERITTDPEVVEQYQPTILSQPSEAKDEFVAPWVVTLETFLTPGECETLIQLGKDTGFERSMVESVEDTKRSKDGLIQSTQSEVRTSSQAWCTTRNCLENPVYQRIMEKLENVTRIPSTNAEYLQLLQYQPGQFYHAHHDFITQHLQMSPGPRILTLYIYLSDVTAGGGTSFPELEEEITVMPKQGKALLWPSVLDRDPNRINDATTHQALPVEQGVKYGANAWFHQRDFKTPHAQSCA